MKYESVIKAGFIRRINRFVAHVRINGREETVHVKNTGRCREILQDGAEVILEESGNPERKTRFSLIAALRGDTLINIDSQAPNAVVYEGIRDGKVKEIQEVVTLGKEKVYGNSRFDLYFETKDRKGYIEVKGVTLEENGLALFPDAPTERGCKHVYEMAKAVEEGYAGYLFFLIQMKGVRCFTPHEVRDPKFAKALRRAAECGVTILAYDSVVTEDGITIGDSVEVRI